MGSGWASLSGLRERWHPRSGPSADTAQRPDPAPTTPPPGAGLWTRLAFGVNQVKWSRRARRSCKGTPESRLGTFGGRGHGDYRGDLTAALKAIRISLTDWHLLNDQAMVRVDGQEGDGVVIADILATGVQIVGRCRMDSVLDHPAVRLVLARAPVAVVSAPESQIAYELFEAAICASPR